MAEIGRIIIGLIVIFIALIVVAFLIWGSWNSFYPNIACPSRPQCNTTIDLWTAAGLTLFIFFVGVIISMPLGVIIASNVNKAEKTKTETVTTTVQPSVAPSVPATTLQPSVPATVVPMI